jgi:hypothetical protein
MCALKWEMLGIPALDTSLILYVQFLVITIVV